MIKGIKDRLIQVRLMRDEKDAKIVFVIIGVLIFALLANIIYLNYAFINKQLPSIDKSSSAVVSPTPVSVIITVIPTQVGPSSVPVSTSQTTTQTNSLVKDYFIPLGSGTNQTSDFADVAGAIAAVDFGGYQNIKEIRFEASVSVPTANQTVTVQLYNVTDKHPVWNSEITMKGGASGYLISDPLIYDSGLKTYQVQMKTQLQYLANLTQSRIHILLK